MSSAVVAKLYPSQPVGPPPMSQAPVTGQSVEELRQLVMSQKQQMNALREEMLRQKQEMMEQFQQMLTKSFQQQENVLAKKIEARRILLLCLCHVFVLEPVNMDTWRHLHIQNADAWLRSQSIP